MKPHDSRLPVNASLESFNRRRFLKTVGQSLGAASFVSLSAEAQGPAPPSNVRVVQRGSAIPGNVLTAANFSYLGCMRMPTNVDTTFAYGGLTGRKVGGQVRLFVSGSNVGKPKDAMYELADTGSYSKDYRSAPRMELVTNWGDIFHGKRVSWDTSGRPLQMNYVYPGAAYWHEGNQLLYWTYFDAYNSTLQPLWNLGATSLD